VVETVDRESWVWLGEPPSQNEVVEAVSGLKAPWGVKWEPYLDFVLPMPNRQKYEKDGVTEYIETWRLYMQVAGRVMMLNDLAEKKKLEVEETQNLIQDDPAVLRLGIQLQPAFRSWKDGELASGPHGIRYGTSKAKGGDSAWEKMETGARGRAIAAWGIGVIPGSGIASVEEMRDLEYGYEPKENGDKQTRTELEDETYVVIEALRQHRQDEDGKLTETLAKYVKDNLGADLLDEDGVLTLHKLKDGQLKLLHRNVKQQAAREMGEIE